MKKIIFAIAIVLTIGLTANAQGRDGFFSSWNDNYNDRGTIGTGSIDNITLPGGDLVTGNNYGNDEPAPLGSGLLVLTALGAGYAVYRKKRK